ncbi:MAG: penicillin-binding protein 1C [Bacteroidales bacterium]|nr:penicillin-binding protein 1C [Bacteroidales bacterium]
MKTKTKKTLTIILAAIAASIIVFLIIPVPKFHDSYSTVLTAENGELLGARIAEDGQWRFPATNTFSDKYMRCVVEYEDKYFFRHCGINPISFIDAAIDNIKAGEVVRGGSTLSMQVVRLARKGKNRTYKEKIIEIILALRLEMRYSKREIFELYAAHAPFGGNVVGIDAAAWRYFNTTPDNLTWSEAATLAVLPNTPSLINLDKNRQRLLDKRNKLLSQLPDSKNRLPRKYRKNTSFNDEDLELSLMETLPDSPYQMPQLAYHYLSDIDLTKHGELVHSHIDCNLQKSVIEILNRHYRHNSTNGIENSAVYIYNYKDEQIIAYVGNLMQSKDAAMVDMVKAQRSTGSILKPFLYAAMLDDGELLPEMILPDIPMNISGYAPKNYSGEFCGAVKANDALAKSLNAPFVYLLRKYGINKFYNVLKDLKLSGLVFPADHYGLSLILGGAEASLYDIVNAYSHMAQIMKFTDGEGSTTVKNPVFSPAAVYLTFQAMNELTRPSEQQAGWHNLSSSRTVAWKTGTSFGFKDAWSVGIVDDYVIGVWVGNSDGEGRTGLTGINSAAPILFDILNVMNANLTLQDYNCDFIEVEVCEESGLPKSQVCNHTKTIRVPNHETMTGVCRYHKKIFLDETRQFRVLPDCYNIDIDNYDIYFVLPPTMEWFYKKNNPTYRRLPPLYHGCRNDKDDRIMSFIYPEESMTLIIPTGIEGTKQSIVFEIAHRNPEKTIYWNLNDKYLGATTSIHQMPIQEKKGKYLLRCIDEDGNEITRRFEIAE